MDINKRPNTNQAGHRLLQSPGHRLLQAQQTPKSRTSTGPSCLTQRRACPQKARTALQRAVPLRLRPEQKKPPRRPCLAGATPPALRELWAESRDLLGLPSSSLDTAAAAVPRVDLPPTPLAFLRDHVSPGRPLLVSAAATLHWPAASLWPTASYLTDALRSTAVCLHLTPDGRADALASHPHPRHPGSSRCFASAHARRVDFPTAMFSEEWMDQGFPARCWASETEILNDNRFLVVFWNSESQPFILPLRSRRKHVTD
ncbi:unnamed protein product [Miscanthus lutarioriparius]|uniref:Cupin-like domain-containing protein n=1 Tax=Miscanthus lutarioriparius TaxID=422564 RepID=A0A811NA44_9POAL|nr:unnamed protein product [Miscanthus lutarioriparius]